MTTFVPGLALGEQFYHEAVKPLLDTVFPGLRYSAALIGSGSEILGFDTPISSDHHWGPRVMLFLDEQDHAALASSVHTTLSEKLPYSFRGYPTNFAPPDPNDRGTQLLQPIEHGPINHRVEILTIQGFVQDYLDFDLSRDIATADWLSFPEQKLRTLTAGAVYHDQIGLQAMRDRFAYYPHDVWLYLLAAGWHRIGQEEHLMGRAGSAGDELGAALIGSRLVRDLMRLCFLMERQYAPYPKWFGTAFAKLNCAPVVSPILRQAQSATSWQERERYLAAAYEHVAAMHNALGITEPLPAQATPFFTRPFLVIWGGRFAEAISARITDPIVAQLAQRPLIGSIDQFSDSTDILSNPSWRTTLRQLYDI